MTWPRIGENTTMRAILFAATALWLSLPAAAQDAPAAAPEGDEAANEDIVVTAVVRGQDRLDTSISVSSLDAATLQASAPRSVAEAFRLLPGIRSESSGGEGNANIAVRGLPVASGGAKFLQLQEDGLPILEFGDITFGNADIFLRADFNVARIETVRGGSASTFASNSPGGVINLISKTGETDGGAVQGEVGIDFEHYRVDFVYGRELAGDWRFHVGGFYRQGEGPRRAGYDGNKGGQIKLNLTKEFARGYVRLSGKYLDDRAIGYLPNPVIVTGTDRDPRYRDVPGFNINSDTLHSGDFTRALTLDGRNQPTSVDIREGQRPLVYAGGFEASFEPVDGLELTNRFRWAEISGRFVSPFPAAVGSAAATAVALGGQGATLAFASGPDTGQAIDPATLGGNGLLAQIVLFNTRLNSLRNVTNDFRASYQFAVGGAEATLGGGFYASRQTIDTDWLWTSHLLSVEGGGDARLVDLRDAAGNLLTQGGTYGYGARFFGNCCRRAYDVAYTTMAPFVSASLAWDRLTLDASARFDFGDANGTVQGADLGGGRVGVTTFDINGDGRIAAPETQVSFIPGPAAPVDYGYDYISYSFGANYRVADSLAAFARYSRGARANADRLLFGPAVSTVSGNLISQDAAVDFVDQVEGGVKFRSGGLTLNATGFYAETEEQNFEATTQRFFDRTYEAYGVELEGAFRRGPFTLTAGGTWTDAEITRDNINPAVEGNTPRRQADFIYQASARYDADRFGLGASVVGTTDSYAQDNNGLELPAFASVNAFGSVRPLERVTVTVNANNVFDERGFTEAEEGSIPANGIVRARSINGRTISAAVRFDF